MREGTSNPRPAQPTPPKPIGIFVAQIIGVMGAVGVWLAATGGYRSATQIGTAMIVILGWISYYAATRRKEHGGVSILRAVIWGVGVSVLIILWVRLS